MTAALPPVPLNADQRRLLEIIERGDLCIHGDDSVRHLDGGVMPGDRVWVHITMTKGAKSECAVRKTRREYVFNARGEIVAKITVNLDN